MGELIHVFVWSSYLRGLEVIVESELDGPCLSCPQEVWDGRHPQGRWWVGCVNSLPSKSLFLRQCHRLTICFFYISDLTNQVLLWDEQATPTSLPLFHASFRCQLIWRQYFLKESVLLCQVLSSAFPSLASCCSWLPGAESFHTWLYLTSWQAKQSFEYTGQCLKERMSKSMRLSGIGFHKNWVSHQSCIVGCPKKTKSPNFGSQLTPLVFIG